MLPGIIGGANWGGGAFDPETAMLYVKTSNSANIARLVQPAKSSGSDAEYAMGGGSNATFHDGIPLLKPPYGHLTAINFNTGELAWQVPFADDARLRAHPALKDAQVPAQL